MLTKEKLLQIFNKRPERYWKVNLFEELGFERKVCPICKRGFWSLKERERCPDPGCGEEYGFIGKKVTKVKWDYVKTWKEFEKFFVKNGHESIPRYPVITTWRDDLFFNIASIVNFQRFDEGVMVFEYPANPLIVPQMCLRFKDIANVGVTGRHYTCFMMPGQHAFNWPKEGYWKDETIELNFRFLTEVMGIPKEEIVYREELWSMPDFSAFGPYIESYCYGLELCNSGFMEFGKHNSSYKELPMKVVDVGWGLERLVWITNSTPTSYECVFGPVWTKLLRESGISYEKEIFERYIKVAGSLDVQEIRDIERLKEEIAKKLSIDKKELEEKISPIIALSSIADHTRALVFAICDGALPSNIGGGYNLRVILRRSLAFINKFNFNLDLIEICFWHIDYLSKLFPELRDSEEIIKKILEVEIQRYKKSREIVTKIIPKLKEKVTTTEDLIKVYQTYGVTPEDLGIKTPADFYQLLTATKKRKREEKGEMIDVSGLPPTEILFYKPVYEFKAKVVKVIGDWVILDKTAFFPKMGGQDFDTGFIDGNRVIEVQKVGNVVLHKIDGNVKEGSIVLCRVDRKRRKILTIHHDAIHLINAAARKILGRHVRQYGAEKTVEKARIDITHYQKLSEEEVEKIEKLANEIVKKNIPIEKFWMDRCEAERKFGFGIYQGGYVPSKKVRIVKIGNFDVEACCGTHGNSTGEIGIIKILRTKRIADGLVRIEIVAGDRALEYLKKMEGIAKECCKELNTKPENLEEAVKDLFERWKCLRKKLKKIKNKK